MHVEDIKEILINMSNKIDKNQEETNKRLDNMDKRLDNVERDINELKSNVKSIDSKADKIIHNQDIFEKAVVDEFKNTNTNMKSGFSKLDSEVEDLKSSNAILAGEDLRIKTDIEKVRRSITSIINKN